jgi:microcystin-dependent protein
MGNLPENFCGTAQELANAIAARLVISSNQASANIVAGADAPQSNVGIWFKDCQTLYVWDDNTGSYVPMPFPTIAAVETGMVQAWAGTIANIPQGYLLCDGSAVLASDYPALYGIIGTQYGTGGGCAGSFNLPDLRDHFIVGARQDDAGTAKSNVSDGATLLKNRDYTAHTHTLNADTQGLDGAHAQAWFIHNGISTTGETPRAIPPFVALAYIIKT